jgi:murein DD-endopeptidase MepM/ murein hydrolase activator NlpD
MTWIRPVEAKISDDFAAHTKRKSVNPGVDYVVPVGTPLVAIADGTVARISNTVAGAGGRVVLLDFPSGHKADYLHLSRVDVAKGDSVKKGQVIGLSGGSGLGKELGYGPHLHLSFRHGGTFLTGTGNIDYEAFIGSPAPAKAPAKAKAAPAPASTHKPGAGRPSVMRGSRGEHVVYLQTKLKLTADGIFGPNTHRAVVDFQRANKLVADGIVGNNTWAVIG